MHLAPHNVISSAIVVYTPSNLQIISCVSPQVCALLLDSYGGYDGP